VGEVGEDLQGRHAALSRRLAAKRNEKGRFVKLYAQGLVDDEELEAHLADLKNQVENLEMLIASVEADLEDKDEEALVARSTEAWLLTLRENLVGVEQDTQEAFEARRELAQLLVEGISVSRGEDGRQSRSPTGSGHLSKGWAWRQVRKVRLVYGPPKSL
jgi:hypothetical protein